MTATPCTAGACGCQRAAAPRPEIHVAGVLIHARPESLADVCIAVSLLPHAEVTHQAEDGRAVAVLEAHSAGAVVQQIDALRSIRGVLNVAMVYQHAEAAEDMDKEMQE